MPKSQASRPWTPTVNSQLQSGWYTLQGVKLAGKSTASGIYVFNGKKVAISGK